MSHRPKTFSPSVTRSSSRTAFVAAALAGAAMVACSDQATAPSAATAAAPVASAGRFDLNSAASTLEWQATARHLVATHPPTYNPLVAGRAYALLSVAQYGAVVGSDENDPVSGGRALYEARRGAVAGASAAMLTYLFPDAAAALENQLASDGAAGPGGTQPHFTRGVATGRAVGAMMIDWANHDGFAVPWNHLAPPDPLGGGWVGVANVAPAGFQFPLMRPYYLTTQSQFRPGPPYAQGTPEFAADLQAVRDATTHRTPADSALAIDWNLNVGTITTLGYWNERAAEYIPAHGLDEREASHVFALMNSTAFDAVIGCWDAKYHYMRLRPTMADGSIVLVVGPAAFPYTLPNHPSYPSGHSCVSASAGRVLASLFPEHTATLNQLVADAGRSRVIGGIHYPSDVSIGQALGRSVADWAMAYDQQPGGLLRAVGMR